MPKIKFTKSELKSQRDSLKQFQRFLPTLQLKKQQLQLEIRKCGEKMAFVVGGEKKLFGEMEAWFEIFSDTAVSSMLSQVLVIKDVVTSKANIAGLDVSVFESIVFEEAEYNLFTTPPALDDALKFMRKSISFQVEKDIIKKQIELISQELRITSQRVNLFEKIKIPETRENIRIIQIYLGDQDTAGVCRSKMAKKKMQEKAA
jgi:V/A-type H+-transporting ATPase subunit D